jgi:hypothetical protein
MENNSQAYNWYREEIQKREQIAEFQRAYDSIHGSSTEANEAREKVQKAMTSLQQAHPRVMQNRTFLERMSAGIGNLVDWVIGLAIGAFKLLADILQSIVRFFLRALDSLSLCFQ